MTPVEACQLAEMVINPAAAKRRRARTRTSDATRLSGPPVHAFAIGGWGSPNSRDLGYVVDLLEITLPPDSTVDTQSFSTVSNMAIIDLSVTKPVVRSIKGAVDIFTQFLPPGINTLVSSSTEAAINMHDLFCAAGLREQEVDRLSQKVAEVPDDTPVLLFGHSLGGVIADHTMRQIPRPSGQILVGAGSPFSMLGIKGHHETPNPGVVCTVWGSRDSVVPGSLSSHDQEIGRIKVPGGHFGLTLNDEPLEGIAQAVELGYSRLIEAHN